MGKYATRVLWSYIEKVRPRPRVPGHNYLFLSPAGDPISANTLKLIFTRLAKTSGVERLHAHLCRHTFATNYLLNGGDIFSLKEILGHTTLEMVNRYPHFSSYQVTALQHKFSPMDRLRSGATNPATRSGIELKGNNQSSLQKIHQRLPSVDKQSSLRSWRSNRSDD